MSELIQSFQVGPVTIWPNLILSPMHGVTDQAFRLLCKRLADGELGLLVSEFVAVEGIVLDIPRETRMMEFSEEERPFAIQIFGSDADLMGKAALAAEYRGADILEVNAGCPAPKVVRRGGGSGLLRDLPNLKNILAQCKQNLTIPLTLKCRIGWSDDEINIKEVLNIAEGEGVELLVIHGRTRLQGYKGLADWERIAEVKSLARIPVVGNGDIKDVDDVIQALKQYGVDGVSIGRGAMHNPWIFKHLAEFYRGHSITIPNILDLKSLLMDYLEMFNDCPYEPRIMGKIKQLASRITKVFEGTDDLRMKLLRSQSLEEFWDHFGSFEIQLQQGESTMQFNPKRIMDLNGKHSNEIQDGCDYKR